MSDTRDDILFNDFSLDTDSAYAYMLKGASRYNLNCLKGEDGWAGEITNLKGNRKVTYSLGLSEVYFTLCSCYDPLTRNVYYWVFSLPYDVTGSGDYEYDNRLLRFNEDTEVIDLIFLDTHNYMGLDPYKPFKDSFVIGDWLYFNPQTSEPKMICITMAYNYTNNLSYDPTSTYVYAKKVTFFGGLFMALGNVAAGQTPSANPTLWERIDDCYQDSITLESGFVSEFEYAFNVIRRPPPFRPTCAYGRDEDIIANDVKNVMLRFASRYKYFDNSYSVYSAYSDVTLPPFNEYYNGDIADDSSLNNYIAVNVLLGSAALVKEVEVVFQKIGEDTWRRAKIINRKDVEVLDKASWVFYFYNNESYIAVDNITVATVYSSVPKKTNAQEIINKNILCYAGCTEGFDNLNKEDIQVNLTAEPEALTILEGTNDIKRNNLGQYSSPYANYIVQNPCDLHYFVIYRSVYVPNIGAYVESVDGGYYYLEFASWFATVGLAAGDKYRMTCTNGVTAVYTLTAFDVVQISSLVSHLAAFMQNKWPFLGATYSPISDIITFTRDSIPGLVESFFYSGTGSSTTFLSKYRGFKTGSWQPFCLFYYDGSLRRWDAQVSKDNIMLDTAWSIDGTTGYVPMLNEYSPIGDGTANKFNIAWEVNHLPPVGAKYWRWGFAGNSLCSSFVQYIIHDIRASKSSGDPDLNITEPYNAVAIDITPLQTLKNTEETDWNMYPNSVINVYNWTPGDRIRFITERRTPTDMGDLVNGIYDLEILKQSADLMWIYVSAQGFDYNAANINDCSLVEIYTPKRQSTELVFYEFGDIMPIIEDSSGVLVHGVGNASIGIQDQDWATSTPASGVFTGGDIYHIVRTPSEWVVGLTPTRGWFHESMWYSDFYESDDYDRGKTGIETTFNEKYLNIVRYSNQYLQDTQINGLSMFEGNKLKELNDVYGNVLRIIEIGDTLKVYQRKKPSSILIGRTEYYDSGTGQANIQATSERVLGSIRYSPTNYGTEYPESISRNNRYVYGFDVYNGVLWRDSANGIFPISGRYESTDGGGDYRMETYFKAKAKALLVSGVGNTGVLTVWDERHKNLYVIFKDYADDDNSEALMFHEPSNKWICFTDMGYTPSAGWNSLLELDYWIISGFEGGIGYVFDEDTRFATFTIVTQADASLFITGTLIVDEDGTTYIIDDTGSEYLIE